MKIISSRENHWLKLSHKLLASNNSNEDFFLAEGEKLIKNIIKKTEILMLFLSENYETKNPEFIKELGDHINEEQVLFIKESLFCSISSLDTSGQPIGIFKKKSAELSSFANSPNLLIFDRIQDPGNLGTLFRTASATGWDSVVCLNGTVSVFNPKVIRATAGMLDFERIALRIDKEILIDFLIKQGFTVIISSLDKGQDINSIDFKSVQKPCLILGNEGTGIDKYLYERSLERNNKDSILVKIPMKNESFVESLNVSVSGGILMYKIAKMI